MAVWKPLIGGKGVSEKLKAASNAFEAAKAVVTLLGVIAFLVILLIGYVATGGDSLGGFFSWLLDGLAWFSG
jgi:hypothetical protein